MEPKTNLKLKLNRRHGLIIGAAILTVLAIVLIAKRQRLTTESGNKQSPVAVLEFLPSDIAEAKRGDIRKLLPVSGSLLAVKKAVIKARVSADVKQVLVREGEAVKAGQTLIRMDDSDHQARLDQAKGAWQAARSQLDIATLTRNNNRALLEKGFISQNAFDNAQSQYSIALSNVKSARGAMDVAQKAVRDTVIRSPLAGYVSVRSVEPGEKVSTDNKLLEIVDLREMEMEAAVPASDIVNVAPGQEVMLNVEGISPAISGKVVRINPAIQAGSRSILVYIRVANEQGLLRAGMFAEGKLTLARREDVLSVPQTAVRTVHSNPVVYAMENGRLVQKQVRLGMQGDDGRQNAIEITSGLTVGAKIIKTNLGNLRDGTRVVIAQSAGAGNKDK